MEMSERGNQDVRPDQQYLYGEEATTHFTYERDLQYALISQVSTLFPQHKIFGNGTDGIEFSIEGKRIDLLLEDLDETELLAIELKAGRADFKAFGQISMYLGLLSKHFPNRTVKGLVIAGSIDESLKHACSSTNKVSLIRYQMKLELDNQTPE